MILEKQCCSLELSKRLREIGVKQISLMLWMPWQEGYVLWPNSFDIYRFRNPIENKKELNVISAFTISELIEFLPKTIQCVGELGIGFDPKDKAYCFYHDGDEMAFEHLNDSLPNALAELLIYLIEEDYVEVNK
jgi:hypothetical protein